MSALTAQERSIILLALSRGVDEHDIAYDLDVPIEAVERIAAVEAQNRREGRWSNGTRVQ